MEPRPQDANHRRPSDVEAWLSSPIRLALLALMAVAVATLATSIGEIELETAGGLDERGASIVWRQGTIWLLWAAATPPLLALANRLGRTRIPWPLVLLIHGVISAAVGACFLGLEIQLTEASQTQEQTERYARFIERGPDFGRGSNGREGANRGGAEREAADRAEERSEAGQPRTPDGARTTQDPDLRRRRRGGGGSSSDRGRWRRRTAGLNIATGHLARDFERRWPLRMPRYVLAYFALIGAGLGIRAFLAGRQQERHAEKLETDLARARLDALRGQLHPHFLFNSLHSVGGLIRTDRGQDALTALASIGDLLRTSLDSKPEQFVSLERELELIDRYVAVESLRLGDRLAVTVEVPQALLEAEVPAFIVQPLVENAIKHAIATRTEGGHLWLRARQDGSERLVIEVEDDGPGYQPRVGHEGVGLAHVRGRLEALFAGTAKLAMISPVEGGAAEGSAGTLARLTLPLDDLEDPLP